jgi:hypothetical protein
MDRREFLRNSAVIMAGLTAVQQMELVERLLHKRTLFPGATLSGTHGYLELIGPYGNVIGSTPWNGEQYVTPLLRKIADRQLIQRTPRAYRMVVVAGSPQHPFSENTIVVTHNRQNEAVYTMQLPKGLPRDRSR